MLISTRREGRFNWQLALVLALGVVVLGGALYWLRNYRRETLANRALALGLEALEAKDWSTAATEIPRVTARISSR